MNYEQGRQYLVRVPKGAPWPIGIARATAGQVFPFTAARLPACARELVAGPVDFFLARYWGWNIAPRLDAQWDFYVSNECIFSVAVPSGEHPVEYPRLTNDAGHCSPMWP
jgi:hypothetical protein